MGQGHSMHNELLSWTVMRARQQVRKQHGATMGSWRLLLFYWVTGGERLLLGGGTKA